MLNEQITLHSGGIARTLAPLDPAHTTEIWHATLRAIEEFINVPIFGSDDFAACQRLMSVPLDERFFANPSAIRWVIPMLSARFDSALAQRFQLTMLQCAALGSAYRQHGLANADDSLSLRTVGGAIGYLQSRRRLLVALLYSMPNTCRGSQRVSPIDTMNVFMPLVEHSGMALVALYRQLLLADLVPDFQVRDDGHAAWGSHHFQPLENFFLEPERVSAVAISDLRPGEVAPAPREQLDPKKIFSAAELRHQLRLIQDLYAGFGLEDTRFATVAKLVIAFSRFCQDDYYIILERAKFDSLLRSQTQCDPAGLESDLINAGDDFVANTNSFAPFMPVRGTLVSNVNLLMRFLNNFKNFALEGRKRFQVHSGFIFEDMIKRDLPLLGFSVTDIKRINRKEFDVVAVRDGIVYNLQCKNNWIDLTKIESDRAVYARYNRYLVWYYRRALTKEKRREDLLKQALGLSEIRHFVISRFPVIADDPNILAYNALASLQTR